MTHRLRLTALAAAVCLLGAPLHAGAAASAKPVAAEHAPAASDAKAHQQILALVDAYYDSNARMDPINATENGDNRYDDQLGLSIAPEQQAKQFAGYRQFLKQLKGIPRAKLDHADRINYDIVEYELHTLLALEPFPEHLLPINQMDSVPVTMANYAGGEASQPIGTVAQYDAYLSRLSQLPAWIDQAIANMRVGVSKGVTQPKAIMVSALPQFQKLVSATPEASIYYTPITKLPAAFSDADKQRLTAAYRATINDQLMPALARLSTFLEKEYIPACRTTTGLGALPNGQAWYQARVALSTTTSLKPAEIHNIGLKEVARIEQQFSVLGPQLGYNGPATGLPVWSRRSRNSIRSRPRRKSKRCTPS